VTDEVGISRKGIPLLREAARSLRRTPGDADKLLARVRAKRCTRNPLTCGRDMKIPGDPIPHCGDTGGECPHEPKPTKGR
jgi:hypothetical protein